MAQTLRFPVAFVAGFLLNATVFWFLWALINVHFASHDAQQATKIEFTRMRHDTEVATIKREKPKLEKPDQLPQTPQITRVSLSRAGTETISAPNLIGPPSIDTKAGLMGGIGVSVGGTDQDVMPLVRINPDYPPRAQSRGIQGWALVQFTITPQGTVKDAKIVDSEPKGVFDEAAVNAVSRWKYTPKVDNGVPVERRGIQVKLTFKIAG